MAVFADLDHVQFSLEMLDGGIIMAIATLADCPELITGTVVDTHQEH